MRTKVLLLVLFLLCGRALAQRPTGASNAGQEFVFSMPPCYVDAGADNSIRIYVSSAEKTEVTLRANGFQKKAMTVPNGVVEFELSPGQGQAYTKGLKDQAQPERVFESAAIHITAGAPIVCYAVTRFHYTSDSFLAIPISALGKDYIVSSYPDMTAMYPTYVLPSLTTITAAYDNTKVNFTLGGNSVTETAGGMKPGQQKQWTLNKGDVIVIGSKGMAADLSGSRITSTKPVAVTSGNQCANIPVDNTACDYIAEMELPMDSWGKEYHYTRLIARKFNNIIRIYAKEDNTNIFLDGQPWKTIQKGGGGRIDENYFEARIPGEPAPHVISADKPIYIVQYNPGQSEDGVSSDPFQMVLTPYEQYLKEITFCTPGIRGGVGFAENYLNLVFELTAQGTIPDDLEFAQIDEFTGAFVWAKLSAKFSGAIGQKFPVTVDGKQYASKIIRLPGDGVYKIRSRSNSRIAVYSYGFDNFDSYGMPTSVALGDPLDKLAPMPQWTMSCEGEVTGLVRDTVDNSSTRTNIARIYTVEKETENYILKKSEFITGELSSVQWNLTPLDKTIPARAVLLFADKAGNETYDTISYIPSIPAMEGGSFGPVRKGISNPAITEKTFTISNPVSSKQLISKISIQPDSSFTMVNEPSYPLLLQPNGQAGSSYELKLRINTDLPQGKHTATITVATVNCGSYEDTLTATIVAPVIEAWDLSFGSIMPGVKSARPISVRNIGTAALIISGVSDFSNAAFRKAAPVAGSGMRDWDFNQPVIVPPGESVKFLVSFSPNKSGAYSDTLRFFHDGEPLREFAVVTGSGSGSTDITEYTDAAMAISPNPAQDYIILSFDKTLEKAAQVSVFDARGEEVLSQSLGAGADGVRLDTRGLTNGSYYIRLGSSGKMIPVVIER